MIGNRFFPYQFLFHKTNFSKPNGGEEETTNSTILLARIKSILSNSVQFIGETDYFI